MAFGVSEELKIVVKAEVDKAVRGLNQVKGSAGGIEKNIKSLGKAAVKYLGPAFLAGAVVKAGKAAVMAAAGYEQLKVSLEVLLGSASKAEKLFESLREFAVKTPLQLDQLARSSTTLMSFGTAANDVVDTLKNLGNLAQGMPDKLDRLVLAYGKVQAKGKATLEELNMFTEAGVPLMAELAKQIGITREELFQYVTEGKIGFSEVDAAVRSMTTGQGQFAGMLEKQSKTLIGLMSTAKDSVTDLAATIGESLLPAVKNIVTEFTNMVTRLTDAIRNTASLRKELQGIEVLTHEEALRATQAQIDIISPLIHGTKGETLIERGRLAVESAARGAIGQTDIANMMMRLSMEPRGELVAMFEALIVKRDMAQARLNVAKRASDVLAPGLSPLLTGGGFNAGAGRGTPIDWSSAYPINLAPIGAVDMPGRRAPSVPVFSDQDYADWFAQYIGSEGVTFGQLDPPDAPTQGNITSPLAMQYGPLGALLGISPFLPGGGVYRGGLSKPIEATQGNITSPLAMQYGPLGALLGISPFEPGGGTQDIDALIDRMSELPIPIDEVALAAERAKVQLAELTETFHENLQSTLIDQGIQGFLGLAEAIGEGGDSLQKFGDMIPAMLGDMAKLVGLQMIQFGISTANVPLVLAGLGLAFVGAGVASATRSGRIGGTQSATAKPMNVVHFTAMGNIQTEAGTKQMIMSTLDEMNRRY